MSAPRLRILLVDDHATVRQGLSLVIEHEADMDVVGEAGDGHAAVQQALELRPDVIVMDISMPGMNGLLATRAILEQLPSTAIVALTRYSDQAYLQELLGAGASGYVLKQSPSSELLQAIRATAAGQQYLDSAITARLTATFIKKTSKSPATSAPVISERETEVLRKIAWGQSNKEVAADLNLSVKTIEVHKANAMRKLGLRGRIDVVKYALLQGWLRDE